MAAVGVAASMLLDWVPASFAFDLELGGRRIDALPGLPATGWGAPVVLVVALGVAIGTSTLAALAPRSRSGPAERMAAAVLPGAGLLTLSLLVRGLLDGGDPTAAGAGDVLLGPALGTIALGIGATVALMGHGRAAGRPAVVATAAMLVLALVVHDDYGTARLNGDPPRRQVIATLATTDRLKEREAIGLENPSGLHGVSIALLACAGAIGLAALGAAAGTHRRARTPDPARAVGAERRAGLGLCAVAGVAALVVGLVDHRGAHGLERFPGTVLALAALGALAAALGLSGRRPARIAG